MLFNTHSHVDTSHQFDLDRESVMERAREMGVSKLLVVGFHSTAVPISLAFAERYDWVNAAIGIHPTEAHEWNQETESLLRTSAAHFKVKAIGEIGLDYYWRDRAPFDMQRKVFRQQISVAKDLGLPILIHDRDAHNDVVTILQEERAHEVGGIMHCFSGDWAHAQRCLALGFCLGIGGTVTYKNNLTGQDVVRRAPLDRLVIETDDPYLAPMPFRGKRNEPGYVRHVAEFIAQLKGISFEEVARVTYANACRALSCG